MPQLVKKRRSGWAVLAAGALVASLLAVGASPAAAEYDVADNLPSGKACVGDAAKDQMFTDVSDGHAFGDAINCIAYYGITNGTGDGSTFSPNDTVSRWEMALFIARAAGPGGVTLPAAADQGFADIGGLFGEARDAINQLAAAEIMAGKSATVYDPNGMVSRADMAVILVNFLAKASKDVRLEADGTITLAATTLQQKADDYFPDAYNQVPKPVSDKISAAYELGITKGLTTPPKRDPVATKDTYKGLLTSFNPGGNVNRGQMAEFITRTLDHTNARPEGVSVQRQDSRLIVSVRDGDFQPRAGVRVDVFSAKTADKAKAFGFGGNCIIPTVVSSIVSQPCRIDNGDPVTNSAGNFTLPLPAGHGKPNPPANTLAPRTVWAWTGPIGDLVLTGTDLYEYDVPLKPGGNLANQAKASDNTLPRALTETSSDDTSNGFKYLRFGTPVTITLQLQHSDAATGAVTDVTTATGGTTGTRVNGPATWEYQIEICSAVPTSEGCADSNLLSRSAKKKVTTDSSGKTTVNVPAVADFNPATKDAKTEATSDRRYVTVTLTRGNRAPTYAPGSSGVFKYVATDQVSAMDITRSDTTRALVKATVSASNKYVTLPTNTSQWGSQLATVTITDQYGGPVAGWFKATTSTESRSLTIPGGSQVKVGCLTAAPDGVTGKDRFDKKVSNLHRTDGRGELQFVYSANNTAPDPDVAASGNSPLKLGVDFYKQRAETCLNTAGDGSAVDSEVERKTSQVNLEEVFFVIKATATLSKADIQHIDVANKKIIVGNQVYTYDSNDQFNVSPKFTKPTSTTASDTAASATLAEFEKALATRAAFKPAPSTGLGDMAASAYYDAAAKVSVFTLTDN